MIRIVADKAIFLVLFLKIGCEFSLCGVLLLVLLLLLLVGFIRGIFSIPHLSKGFYDTSFGTATRAAHGGSLIGGAKTLHAQARWT
jgi:hypothetical protein